MTDRIDEIPPLSIPEQAAEWLLRWHCGDLNIAERFEYLQWLKTSPVHIAEMLRMCRLYSWLENARLQLYVTNEDSFSNVVELPPREREASAAHVAGTGGLWRTRMAAGVAAIALTAALAFAAKVSWLDHTLQTQGSEWRSVPLSDGSSVTAAPYTKLRHDIDAKSRVVRLTRGLAVFRVASDPSRPFLVEAGGIVVLATGTQFTVERRKDRVTVTMTEGSVVVRPSEGAAATFDTVPLVMNQQLTITDAGAPAVDEVDAEKERQRAEGKLIFKPGDTISYAVEQFNEFNVIKIEVDEATGARPMRGSFDAIDPLSFAASVQRATGSPWVWESSERLRIGPEEPGSR